MMTDYKYKAFISYSHADAKLTKWLHRKLEAYKVPKHLVRTAGKNGPIPERLFPIFRDRDDLAATTHMSDAILEAIQQSEFMIVVCTPASAKSKLVGREIEEFKRHHNNKNILCLIADGVPFSNDPETDCFSDVLKMYFTPGGTATGWAPEGLAADIRPGSDEKRAAVSKLVAGILSIELNDLLRRELQWQKRKLLWGLVGSGVIVSVISVLLVMTYNAQQLAEKRTDELLNYLLESQRQVFQGLGADGNTIAQETLIRLTLDQYKNFNLKNADVKTLGLWSGAALRLAQNFERQGKNKSASDLFDQIREFSAEFAANHPNNHLARFRRQNAEFFYGYLQQRLGNYEEAEAAFRKRLAISSEAINDPRLTIQTPGIFVEWGARVADAQKFLGNLLAGPVDKLDEGNNLINESIANWQQGIRDFEPNENDQNDSYYQWSLGDTYRIRGDLDRRMGELAAAQQSYQNTADIFNDLLNLAPTHGRIIRRIGIADLALAQTASELGDIPTARAKAATATATFTQLVEGNSVSVLWLSDLVAARNLLIRIALIQKDFDTAKQHLDANQIAAEDLFQRDRERPQHRLSLYKNELLQIEHAFMVGANIEAEAMLSVLIETLESETPSFAKTNGAMEFMARTYLISGMVSQTLESETSTQHLKQVTDIVSSRPHPWPEALAYQAKALKLLGDTVRADTIFSELDAINFKYSVFLDSLPS